MTGYLLFVDDLDWKVLLSVERAQVYLEMTKLAPTEWVTEMPTSRHRPQAWVFITSLRVWASSTWDSRAASPFFFYYKGGDKVEHSTRSLTIFNLWEKWDLCFLLIISVQDLASLQEPSPLASARTESFCLIIGEFIPFLIWSLDPDSETSDLPAMTHVSSSSTLCILFPRGQDGSGVVFFYLIS